MVDETAPRTVPGAPPTANTASASSKKKNKAKKKAAASQQAQAAQPAPSQPITATTSALLSTTPSATEVDALLLGSLSDARTEQAQSSLDASLSPAAAYLSKRVKVLNKKLQRIATYDVKTLNVDQQRAISSKDALEMSVAELSEAKEGIQSAEKEREEAREKDTLRRLAEVKEEAQTKAAQPLALLFRFFALASYFDPSGPPSFAPRPLPAALENVGASTVHAVRQLHAALTLNGEDAVEERERRRETAHSELERLSTSSEEVIGESGVSYAQIHALIQSLDSPSAPQANGRDIAATQKDSSSPHAAAAAAAAAAAPAALPAFGDIEPDTFTAPSSPPPSSEAAPSAPAAAAADEEPAPELSSEAEVSAFLPIRFMQEDEVQEASSSSAAVSEYVATQQTQQHSTFQPFSDEPTPSFTPAETMGTPEPELSKESEQAEQTTEETAAPPPAPEAVAAAEEQAPVEQQESEKKGEDKFNWADDVEEQADLDSAAASTTLASTVAPSQPAPSTPSPAVAAPAQSQPSPQPKQLTEAQLAAVAARRAAQEAQRRADAIAAAKAARIDDDGFERVAPRKVKLPPQQQQSQGQRGRGGYVRGAGQRGGAAGRGGFQGQSQGRGGFVGAQYAQGQGQGQQQGQQQQGQQQQQQGQQQQQPGGANRGRGGKTDGGASRGGFAEGQRGRGGAANRGRGRGGAAGAGANGSPAPPAA